jgi:hypothetical protein
MGAGPDDAQAFDPRVIDMIRDEVLKKLEGRRR